MITPADIEETARSQQVAFRPGDVVLMRTGWINTYRTPFRKDEFAGRVRGRPAGNRLGCEPMA